MVFESLRECNLKFGFFVQIKVNEHKYSISDKIEF